jgi:hypothetical protein
MLSVFVFLQEIFDDLQGEIENGNEEDGGVSSGD